MMRDDTEKLKLGYLSQVVLFQVSVLLSPLIKDLKNICASQFSSETPMSCLPADCEEGTICSVVLQTASHQKNWHRMAMQSKKPPSAFPGWDGFSELPSYIGLGSFSFFFFPFRKAVSLSLNRCREQSCGVRGLRAGVDNSKALPAIFSSLLSCL